MNRSETEEEMQDKGKSVMQNDLTATMRDSYGDKFQEHLIDQYKLYLEMADKISLRRSEANKFYISLLSALLALFSLVIEKKIFPWPQSILLLFTSVLGLIICFVWYINIQSYKQLNSLKFQVVHEMEQYLPFPSFSREWEILKDNKNKQKNYIRLTFVEQFVPVIFAIPYVCLIVYSLIVL